MCHAQSSLCYSLFNMLDDEPVPVPNVSNANEDGPFVLLHENKAQCSHGIAQAHIHRHTYNNSVYKKKLYYMWDVVLCVNSMHVCFCVSHRSQADVLSARVRQVCTPFRWYYINSNIQHNFHISTYTGPVAVKLVCCISWILLPDHGYGFKFTITFNFPNAKSRPYAPQGVKGKKRRKKRKVNHMKC